MGFSPCADPAALQAACDAPRARRRPGLLRPLVAAAALADHRRGPRGRLRSPARDQSTRSQSHAGLRSAGARAPLLRSRHPRESRPRPTRPRAACSFPLRLTRATPPPPFGYRTRVITDGVQPSLHVEYKHSHVKQYFKEQRALRTETTINNPRDFYVRKGRRQSAAPARFGRAGQPQAARSRARQSPLRADPGRARPPAAADRRRRAARLGPALRRPARHGRSAKPSPASPICRAAFAIATSARRSKRSSGGRIPPRR